MPTENKGAAITVETTGRRAYFRGDTYPVREQLRAAGAHWDRDARAWWVGSAAKAQELLARIAPVAEAAAVERDAVNAQIASGAVCTWTKQGDAFVVRSTVRIEAGQTVQVRKASGEVQAIEIASVVDAEDARDGGRVVWLGTPVPRKSSGPRTYTGNGGRKYAWRGPAHLGRRADAAPGGRTCPNCGSRECARAWNPRDLCDED